MKLPELKQTLNRSVKILALSIGLATSLTACTFSFEKELPTDKTSTISVESISKDVEAIVNNTNWEDIKQQSSEAASEFSKAITQKTKEFAEENDLGEFQKAKIIRVVDGDTIVVDIEGAETKVRLIGIDTPESVASQEYLERTGKQNTKEGKSASAYTEDILKNTQYVYLQKDTSDTDKYNRLLRYVWLEVPNNEYDLNEIATKMLNGILVRDHVANVATYEPDTKHADDFQTIYDSDYDDFSN